MGIISPAERFGGPHGPREMSHECVGLSNSERFQRYFADNGYNLVSPVGLIAGDADPTTIFIGSSSSVWRDVMRKGPQSPLALWQPKLRTHNLNGYYTQDVPPFMSYFEGGGILSSVEGADTSLRDAIAFFSQPPYSLGLDRIVAHYAPEDEPIFAQICGKVKLQSFSACTNPPDAYVWSFGELGLTGRGMMLAVRSTQGPELRDVASCVMVRSSGAPTAFEIGFGHETLLSAAQGKPHPIYSSPILEIMSSGTNSPTLLKLADALYASAAIINTGVSPGSAGKKSGHHGQASTVLDQYLRAIFYLADNSAMGLADVQTILGDAIENLAPDNLVTDGNALQQAQDYLGRMWIQAGNFSRVMRQLCQGGGSANRQIASLYGGKQLVNGAKVDVEAMAHHHRYPNFVGSPIFADLVQAGYIEWDQAEGKHMMSLQLK